MHFGHVCPCPSLGLNLPYSLRCGTRTGHIGVLATCRTIESQKYADVRHRAIEWAEVSRPMPVTVSGMCLCPGLMECVERGDFDSANVHELLVRYVDPLTAHNVDEIVLGCTLTIPSSRTPFAKHAPKATLIDPAPAVAQQLERRLAALDLATPQTAPGTERFFASGADAAREAVLRTSGLILASVCTKWTKGAASGADLEKFRLTLHHIRSKSFADFGRDTPRDKLIV